jgi:hypothetical protein
MADQATNAKTRLELRDALAFTILRLGDNAMESDKFTQALEDYENCLAIRLADEPSTSRNLAEVYLQMGLAHAQAASTGAPDVAELSMVRACESYAKSCSTLIRRLVELRGTQGAGRAAGRKIGLVDELAPLADKFVRADSLQRIHEAIKWCYEPGEVVDGDETGEAGELKELVNELCNKVEFAVLVIKSKLEASTNTATTKNNVTEALQENVPAVLSGFAPVLSSSSNTSAEEGKASTTSNNSAEEGKTSSTTTTLQPRKKVKKEGEA